MALAIKARTLTEVLIMLEVWQQSNTARIQLCCKTQNAFFKLNSQISSTWSFYIIEVLDGTYSKGLFI